MEQVIEILAQIWWFLEDTWNGLRDAFQLFATTAAKMPVMLGFLPAAVISLITVAVSVVLVIRIAGR